MLNISEDNINIDKERFQSFKKVEYPNAGKTLTRFLYALAGLVIILLFLPWTQNISSTGKVTTLYLDERPQYVQSAIAGRIEEWFVREGQFVHAGDPIIRLSEIKDDYLDPQVIERTNSQVNAKASAVASYKEKVSALDAQIAALEQNRGLKLQQAKNKIRAADLKMQADSIEYQASLIQFAIADTQLTRQEKLFKDGLVSLTALESRRAKFQQANAKKIESESKWIGAKNEFLNAKLEYNAIVADYADKLAKSRSDKFESLSNQYKAEEELAKLENKLSNLEGRVNYRIIRAPQDGFITQATSSGIGETIKEGEDVVTIVPSNQNLAVEIFVRPVDLPLISLGEEVRLVFDGWPVIVFSGWPNVSFGTFGGTIVGIDNVTSANGKYRLLIAPKEGEEHWPELLRVGSGARGFALLNDVPIWYELWRQLNGFPPDFYIGETNGKQGITNKKGVEKPKQ